MPEQSVSVPSAGLRLNGVVRVPDSVRPGERRAAFLVLHGFGSNCNSSNVMAPTKVLNDLGYVTLRFDMRGCGKSEGDFATSPRANSRKSARSRDPRSKAVLFTISKMKTSSHLFAKRSMSTSAQASLSATSRLRRLSDKGSAGSTRTQI